MDEFVPPPATDLPAPGKLAPGAVVVEGRTHLGKPCRIVDNTGSVSRSDLEATLERLIEDRRFGLTGLSPQGGNRIPIAQPSGTHVQFGERLYRILLFPYEARIEPF